MKRRTLLKFFPSFGLALIAPKVLDVADRPVSEQDSADGLPDEEFLRDIYARIYDHIENQASEVVSNASIRVKSDKIVWFGDKPLNEDSASHPMISLSIHFGWGDGRKGPYRSYYVSVKYEYGSAELCIIDACDVVKRYSLPEDRSAIIPFILDKIVLTSDEIAELDRVKRAVAAR